MRSPSIGTIHASVKLNSIARIIAGIMALSQLRNPEARASIAAMSLTGYLGCVPVRVGGHLTCPPRGRGPEAIRIFLFYILLGAGAEIARQRVRLARAGAWYRHGFSDISPRRPPPAKGTREARRRQIPDDPPDTDPEPPPHAQSCPTAFLPHPTHTRTPGQMTPQLQHIPGGGDPTPTRLVGG